MISVINAVIFDLDGVIADSEPLHRQVEKSLLGELGINIDKDYTGIRFDDMIKKISSDTGIDLNVKSLAENKCNMMIKLSKSNLQPIEHSIDLINSLSGLKLAVATGCARNFAEFVLKKFGIYKKFDVIVTSEDVKSGKPDPETFLMASKKLGVDPEKCLAIEDANKGVRSAKSAGMKCIGFVSPHTTPQDLSEADHIVNDLMEVRRFLQ